MLNNKEYIVDVLIAGYKPHHTVFKVCSEKDMMFIYLSTSNTHLQHKILMVSYGEQIILMVSYLEYIISGI
jgi:hypothetical protein